MAVGSMYSAVVMDRWEWPEHCASTPLPWSPLLPPHWGAPIHRSHREMHRLGYLVTGFIALSYRNVNCSSTQQAGTKLLILFKIRAGRKMCHSIYFAKEKSFLAFLLLFFFCFRESISSPRTTSAPSSPPHWNHVSSCTGNFDFSLEKKNS